MMKADLIDRSGNFVATVDVARTDIGVIIMSDSRVSLRNRTYVWNGHQYQECDHLFVDGSFKIVD